MSEESKKARNAMKEKAKRLAHGDPHQKVDSSTWTPGEPINADIKTGMRPISKRAFKKGGKVIGKAEGHKSEHRSDRKPRASGGKALTADSLINRDLKEANKEREGGEAHVGGFKTGGRTKKFGGGPIGQNPIGQQNQMMGQAAGMSPIVRKHGGKTSHPDEAADKALIKKMVKPEARKAHGGKIHDHDCTCHKCWGGRTGKEKGGEVFSGAGYPFKIPGATGGRSAHARGGKAKGKTNINIIIGAHPHDQSGGGIPPNAPMPAPNAGRPSAVPMPMPMPPAGGGMPMGAPPMGGAPGGMPMGAPPMPRKSGGRTNYPIHDGAGGGEGRLEKIKSYGMKPSR